MNKIIISGICILVCFIMFISGCKKSSFTEKDIIGDWEAIKGDYEAITFSKEDNLQRFYTYLNGSLFTDGTWAIMSNKDIILKLTTGENEVWKNVRIENKVLSIDGGKQKYQRLETVQEKIDELISLLGSIEEINFSNSPFIEWSIPSPILIKDTITR